jgi:hypothetical protein
MLSSSLNKWMTKRVRIIRRKVINESVEVLYGIQLLFALFERMYMSAVLFVKNCNLLMEKGSLLFHLITLEHLFIVMQFIALYLASSVWSTWTIETYIAVKRPILFFFSVALRLNAGHGLLILEVSRSLTTTQRSRWDSSGWVIGSSQRPLPDNKQHSQQTDIHASGGIWTHDLSRRAAADLRLRPHGHWDRQIPHLPPHFTLSFRITLWSMRLANSKRQPCFYPP